MLESRQELSARFILVRRLGAGGSGEVWLAQDRERGCLVAVKVLADPLRQEPRAVAALEAECLQLRSLDHPNILRVDGVYRSDQHVWLAMEYASGGDLRQLRGRSCTAILRCAIAVAQALAHAHRAGLVHRDVKASNVLLSSDGSPRLADFGVALALAAAPPAHAGRGSPFSMSPQQRSGAAANVADDIYGFGAMLYELLAGYPPGYAGPEAESAQLRAPAPLPASIPPALAQLVSEMIAAAPTARPADMDAVERALTGILQAISAAPVNDPDGSSRARIEPPSMRPHAAGEPLRSEWRRTSPAGTSAQHLRHALPRGVGTAAAIALGIIGVVIVFFALPQWVAPDPPARYAPAASTGTPAAPAEKKTGEVDFALLARLKQQAEEQRAAIDERWQKLTARGVEQWGDEQFRRVRDELAAGDTDLQARQYATAVEHFTSIPPLLAELEQRAGAVLSEQLKSGAQALSQGRSAQARQAFELALKIDPKHQGAAQGLKRAATLDAVLGLVASAEQLEKQGDLPAAAAEFRRALALDGQAPRATEALARIQARTAGDAFASAMARGYGALANADYAGARDAFDAARKINPNAPQIDQALRQIEQEQRTIVIADKLRTAQEHEQQERWAQALGEYRAVVELDSTVAAAQQGVARVTPRAQLNEQLELYLTQPERLFSQPVRAAARETLARAAGIPQPGPVLTRQVDKLGEWLARADVPVRLALQSDNLTQVTIQRVGALGAFEQRALELAPGTYTLVGTRPGYRDVRRQINLAPGTQPGPILIRCEDRI